MKSRIIGLLSLLIGVYFIGYGIVAGVIREDIMVGQRHGGSKQKVGEQAREWGFIYIGVGAVLFFVGIWRLRK